LVFPPKSKKRKVFFFEKKKQKTFVIKSFLVLFCKKEPLFLDFKYSLAFSRH